MPGSRRPEPACPPLHVNLARAIGRDYSADKLDPSTLPFLRAFGIGYTATVLPTLLKFLIGIILAKRSPVGSLERIRSIVKNVVKILLSGLRPTGAPVAYGFITGGAKWGERYTVPLARRLLRRYRLSKVEGGEVKHSVAEALDERDEYAAQVVGTFASSALSALIALSMLQSAAKERPRREREVVDPSPYAHIAAGGQLEVLDEVAHPAEALRPAPAMPKRRQAQGRRESPTLELTLFALVRGLDTAARAIYFNLASHRRSGFLGFIARHADVLLFQLSCYRIMWSWFYHPSGLPRSYTRWISQVARTDKAVLDLYRHGHSGAWRYGETTSEDAIASGRAVAQIAGMPPEAGDPNLIKWMPCYAVHGPEVASHNCEVNALKRWFWMWRTAMAIYTPVHLIPRLIFGLGKIRHAPLNSFLSVLTGASRSSSFLASFLALIWYSICLTRTRIGPNLLPFVPQNTWDSGTASFFGCFACGFSVLIENKRRRGEMALYVAPRAVYAVLDQSLPSWLLRGRRGALLAKYTERITFALSAATIVTASVHRPYYVRGVVNGLMTFIMHGRSAKQRRSPKSRTPSEDSDEGKAVEEKTA